MKYAFCEEILYDYMYNNNTLYKYILPYNFVNFYILSLDLYFVLGE